MFTYVGLFRLAPMAREHPEKTPEYFDKIHKIVEVEGGTVERFLAVMGPWEYFGIFEYPDLEAAFRVLGKIPEARGVRDRDLPRRRDQGVLPRSSSSFRSPSQGNDQGPPEWRPSSFRGCLRLLPDCGSGFALTALLIASARMDIQRRSYERIGEAAEAPKGSVPAPRRSHKWLRESPHLESRDEYELTHDTGSPHLESRSEYERTHVSA